MDNRISKDVIYTKIEEELHASQIWEAQLTCGCVIQFVFRTEEEKENNGIMCPIHSNKYKGFIVPVYQGIVTLRKRRI